MKTLLTLLLTGLVLTSCGPEPESAPPALIESFYGAKDPAWAADPYNAAYRIFPNAPQNSIVTYNYFDQNAPPSYWNSKGHNHKYPDPFHFANGNKVQNVADWEIRRKEISAILQYYMHGRMPSIAADELRIRWQDNNNTNTCTILIQNLRNNKSATFSVVHTPPAGATAGAKNGILLFGVGMAPAARAGWGTATFETSWGGAENNRSGTCATLYGLTTTAPDTPSVNMQYAWAMSVILTVIEEGGLGGYYDPAKIGIYGFSRWGKAAMIIGAFAEGRGGAQMGFTFVGSAGSGGPAIDRWINQMGYKGHTEDPLPVGGAGAMAFADLQGITWYMRDIDNDDHNAATATEAVRGWDADTPGIPPGALIYDEHNETNDWTRNPGPPNSWGRIQVLAQARSETPGWFSARFSQLQDLHVGLSLDKDSNPGIVCTMPFDAHYIAALIAPRIIYYEDGYNTVRNNPEGQWANWLICDELYQMYAEEKNEPAIIWRNAIKMYDIEHMHYSYQNEDEYDLVTAIYADIQPNAKFRTPPFPVDDPRYRWDFNRMDFGRPGKPTIAERVRRMRESDVPVKAMDTRGLLDNPEPL